MGDNFYFQGVQSVDDQLWDSVWKVRSAMVVKGMVVKMEGGGGEVEKAEKEEEERGRRGEEEEEEEEEGVVVVV